MLLLALRAWPIPLNYALRGQPSRSLPLAQANCSRRGSCRRWLPPLTAVTKRDRVVRRARCRAPAAAQPTADVPADATVRRAMRSGPSIFCRVRARSSPPARAVCGSNGRSARGPPRTHRRTCQAAGRPDRAAVESSAMQANPDGDEALLNRLPGRGGAARHSSAAAPTATQARSRCETESSLNARAAAAMRVSACPMGIAGAASALRGLSQRTGLIRATT